MVAESHPPGGERLSREPSLDDVAQFCRELNQRGAKYVLVGGFAISLHSYPRLSLDIDFLIETGSENEAKVLEALALLPDGAARRSAPKM